MFGQKKDLFELNIVHSLPGRIRLNCKAIEYLNEFNEQILQDIVDLGFVKKVTINNITKNILIVFDKTRIDEADLKNLVSDVLNKYYLYAYKQHRELEASNIIEREREEDVKDIGKRLVLNAGLIGYSIIKKTNYADIFPVYKRFLNPCSLGALYLTKSLFKDGIGGMIKHKRPNADTLTISSIVSSILLGNSSSALTIILLSDIAEFMTSYTMKKTRDSIKHMIDLNEEFVWKQDENGSVKRISVEDAKVGDKIVVHTGEKICVDGKIISGEAIVDEGDIVKKGDVLINGANTSALPEVWATTFYEAKKTSNYIDVKNQRTSNKKNVYTISFYDKKFKILRNIKYKNYEIENKTHELKLGDYTFPIKITVSTFYEVKKVENKIDVQKLKEELSSQVLKELEYKIPVSARIIDSKDKYNVGKNMIEYVVTVTTKEDIAKLDILSKSEAESIIKSNEEKKSWQGGGVKRKVRKKENKNLPILKIDLLMI